MSIRQVVIDIPEKVLLAEKTDEASFALELRTLAAVKLYELGRLSSGRAAELASSCWLPQLFDRVWTSNAVADELREGREAQARGLAADIEPLLDRLRDSGMWISEDVRRRVLSLASRKPDSDSPSE